MKQLNINPTMDALARENGVGHWSCVSPLLDNIWVRSDGCTYSNGRFCSVIDGRGDLIITMPYTFPALKICDEHCPIGKDWQQPRNDLIAELNKPTRTEDINGVILEYDSFKELAGRIAGLITGKLSQTVVSDYDLNIIRQWFNCIKDCNPKYFDSHDFRLAKKLHVDTDKEFSYYCDREKKPTLVQKPFQYPCDGALYFLNSTKHQAFPNCQDKRYTDILTTSHIVGVMIWDENGENLQGSDEFLIMMVWE